MFGRSPLITTGKAFAVQTTSRLRGRPDRIRLARARAAWYTPSVMAKRCDVCGKGPMAGNNVSHAMNKTKRRWLPNLQAVRIEERGTHLTARVCTSCLRSRRVKRA